MKIVIRTGIVIMEITITKTIIERIMSIIKTIMKIRRAMGPSAC